ncbi:T9SS type A sorting domain-containing protein [Winogradskyella sp. PE311]|uniref:T9SS type A sorting domain-containing protein n=1 Tax=Winogradskyella sp. PE311 TaxID=3366943 RepID=UPI0039810CFF
MNELYNMNIEVKILKRVLCTLFLLSFSNAFYAQEHSEYRIIRSNLGSGGSSQNVLTTNGTYKVSQSIGQSSVIGTHSNNGYFLRQGYQQPTSKIKITKNIDYSLSAKVYPNPFINAVTITFSDVVLKNISVMIFDVNSKIIHDQEFLPLQEVEINVQNISNGIYFLRVISGSKQFNTKLIKI